MTLLQWLRSNLREVALFGMGGVGFIHEIFFVRPPVERPFLVAASMALMGLPFVLQGDSVLTRRSPSDKAAAAEAKKQARIKELQKELEKLQ